MGVKRIAIYARKSRESDTGDSIESQIQMCKNYCEQNMIAEQLEYFIYQDYGWSGKDTNRPDFKKLIKDIEDNKVDVLICYRLDRISRSVADFSSTLELLQEHNCSFVSVKEHFDTSNPIGKAMIYISSVFAQLERETIAERVRDNMINYAKQGIWLGGSTPIGFTYERVKYLNEEMIEKSMCVLKENKEDLETVKHIFNVYLKEDSLTQSVKVLLQEGVKSQNNKTLQSISLIRILRNPIYVKSNTDVHEYLKSKSDNVYGSPNGNGYITYGKNKRASKRTTANEKDWIYAVSKHKGVIDADTWLKVQKMLDKNSGKKLERTGTGKNNPALLSGLIKCSKCGSNMVIRKNATSYFYVCSGKVNRIENICDCKNIKVSDVDRLVLSQIDVFSKDMLSKELEAVLKEVKENNFEDNTLNKLMDQLEEKKKISSGLIKRVALAPTEEIAEMFMQQITEINKETKEIESRIESIKNKEESKKIDKDNLMIFISSLKDFRKSIESTEDIMQKRSLIKTIIKKVVWNPETYNLELEFIEDISEDFKKK